MKLTKALISVAIMLSVAGPATASITTFEFTGRLTVTASNGIPTSSNDIIRNFSAFTPYDTWQTPVSATLTYDSNIGVTSTTFNVTMGEFLGSPTIVHDITTVSITGNLINAQLLGDWAQYSDIPVLLQWDATGLMNAINYGLQVNDKLSGNNLYRDFNNDHVYDPSELVTTLGSATPYSDSLIAGTGVATQGFAPLAATSATTGYDHPDFVGNRAYLDIGSGNSMYVTSVSAVPAPAALWLFGSGLLGLISAARRKVA